MHTCTQQRNDHCTSGLERCVEVEVEAERQVTALAALQSNCDIRCFHPHRGCFNNTRVHICSKYFYPPTSDYFPYPLLF